MSFLLILGVAGIVAVSELLIASCAGYYTWQYIRLGYDKYGEVKWWHFGDKPTLRALAAAVIFISMLLIFNFFGLIILLFRTFSLIG